MKNFSRFDLGMIIAFVVVALLGGGVWYYLSGEIASAQDDVRAANDTFLKYSSKEVYLPTPANVKILQDNIDLMKAQLDPLIKTKLQPKENKLSSTVNEDTVAWKHKLDDQVHALNAAAKIHGVDVPANYYYSFARYLNAAPTEEKTGVLSKQLLGVEQIAEILIAAPVKDIRFIKRTYEEDAPRGAGGDAESIGGHAIKAAGGIYTAYPFQVEFDATTDSCRKVINGLVQSPYIFVIRTLAFQNSRIDSPQIGDLDKLAGIQAPTTSILDSPGEASATKSTAGPQFLFGSETVHVQINLDLIEWNRDSSETPAATTTPPSGTPPSRH